MTTQLLSLMAPALKLFQEGFYTAKAVQYKGTVDLLTEYDLSIEAMLKETLSKAFPHHTIIGEEGSSAHERPARAIYIDPIDGTTNFVHALPHCAISVGVWEDGKPIAGVVANPILGEIFRAEKGKGAFLNDMPLHVSPQSDFQQSLIATGFPYTKVERGEDLSWVLRTMQTLLPITRDIRRLGAASLDLCYVAQGKFEAYYECNLKPWDVAAGILILQEAGGMVSNERGEAYALGNHIMLSSNGLVHEALLEALRS